MKTITTDESNNRNRIHREAHAINRVECSFIVVQTKLFGIRK